MSMFDTVGKTAGQAGRKDNTLRKLNAAKGDGYIFQSDHSESSAVSGQTYDYIVKLVREYGQYPIRLPTGLDESA